MRKKEDHLEREMAEVSVQNKRLADPLQKAREEMSEMQKQLANYQRDKQILLVSFLLDSSPSLARVSLDSGGRSITGAGRETGEACISPFSALCSPGESKVWGCFGDKALIFHRVLLTCLDGAQLLVSWNHVFLVIIFGLAISQEPVLLG